MPNSCEAEDLVPRGVVDVVLCQQYARRLGLYDEAVPPQAVPKVAPCNNVPQADPLVHVLGKGLWLRLVEGEVPACLADLVRAEAALGDVRVLAVLDLAVVVRALLLEGGDVSLAEIETVSAQLGFPQRAAGVRVHGEVLRVDGLGYDATLAVERDVQDAVVGECRLRQRGCRCVLNASAMQNLVYDALCKVACHLLVGVGGNDLEERVRGKQCRLHSAHEPVDERLHERDVVRNEVFDDVEVAARRFVPVQRLVLAPPARQGTAILQG